MKGMMVYDTTNDDLRYCCHHRFESPQKRR
jgi:hypothetical protein